MDETPGVEREAELKRLQWENRLQKMKDADADKQSRQKRIARFKKISKNPLTIAFVACALIAIGWYGVSTYASNSEAASKAAQNAIEERAAAVATIRDLGSKKCAGASPTLSENDGEISVQGSIEVTNDIVVFGREMRCVATALPIDWKAVGQQLASIRDGNGSISAGQLQQTNFTFRWEGGLATGDIWGNSTGLRTFQIVVTK
jgi:hypothetical protein